MGTNKGPVHLAGQVAENRPIPAIPSEIESAEAMIGKLLPTPATPTLQAAPKDTDRDILVRQLMEMISPPTLVAHERRPMNDVETPLFNRSPKRTVTEGCFSCREGTHNTEKCQALDESFPFLPIGWVAERHENTFSLGPGTPSSPQSHQTGNDNWSGDRGWSPGPAMPTDPNSQ